MGMATRRTRKRPKTGDSERTPYRLAVAERMYRLRIRQRLTTIEAGEAIGCSAQAVGKWERAESLPAPQFLLGIAAVYGVSLDWLLRPEDDNTVAILAADRIARIARAAAGQPKHPLWGEMVALELGEATVPLHGAASVEAFRESYRLVRDRGLQDDVRNLLAWIPHLDG